jgi:hypothetical protein
MTFKSFFSYKTASTGQQFENLKRGLYILLGLEGTYRPAVMIEQISKLVRDNAQLRSENDKLRGKLVRKNVLRCSISCPTFGLNLSEETTS